MRGWPQGEIKKQWQRFAVKGKQVGGLVQEKIKSVFSLWRKKEWMAWGKRWGAFLSAVALLSAAVLWFFYLSRVSENFLKDFYASFPWATFILLPGGLCFIAWLQRHIFPGTEGTGIPQTIAALKMENPEKRGEVLSFRIALGKLILTTIGLFSGASIGREGPSVHVGACLMQGVSKWCNFPPHLVQRGLILAGGAAGIAASFNAPIAGLVFTFEEIGRSFEKKNASSIIQVTGIACLILFFMFPQTHFFYGKVNVELDQVSQWFAVIVLGLVLGLLGGIFSQGLVWLIPKVLHQMRQHPFFIPGMLGLVLALLGWVSQGESLGSGFLDARRALIEHESLSPLYPFYRAAATFLTLLSGIPGGLFDPTLSAGAGFGQLLAPFFPNIPIQALLMMAMVGYFTGVVQSPMTAFIIMVEMTGAVMMSLPLLAVALLAYEASRLVCPTSLYEALAEGFLQSQKSRESAQPL